jgi:cyclin-dependent kinase-like
MKSPTFNRPCLMFSNQLYVIQKVMGPLTSDQNEMYVPHAFPHKKICNNLGRFLRNPRFLGLKFPDMTRPETLEKR